MSEDDDPTPRADRDDPGKVAEQLEREASELEREGDEVGEHIDQTEQELRAKRAGSDVARSLRTADKQYMPDDAAPEQSQPEDPAPAQHQPEDTELER